MGLIGNIMGKIGQIATQNQETANVKHAKNDEQRAQTEEAKQAAHANTKEAIAKINSQEDPNSSVFGEMGKDIAGAAKAVVNEAGAAVLDAASDAANLLEDAAIEVEKGAKDVAGAVGTAGKAAGGFFAGVAKGIANLFGGIAKSGAEGAQQAIDD